MDNERVRLRRRQPLKSKSINKKHPFYQMDVQFENLYFYTKIYYTIK